MKLPLKSFALFILMQFWCGVALALTIPASEDTSGVASITTGSSTTEILTVDATRKAFLYFNLDDIPGTAVVRWAKLRLFLPSVERAGNGLSVYVVSGSWNESSSSSEVPAPAISSVPVASIDANKLASKRFVTADVTEAVQRWISGGRLVNEGFAIRATAGAVTALVGLTSKEGIQFGLPAELDIDFQPEPLAPSSVSMENLSDSLKSFLTPAFPTKPAFLPTGSLEATALGVGNLSYRWYRDGKPVAGATGASISLNGLLDGNYKVVASNGLASGTSSTVVFERASKLPAFRAQPAVTSGGSLVASGSGGFGPFTYQWFCGTSAVPGGTGTLASIPLSAGVATGAYSVKLSNAFGTVSSGTVYFDRSKYEKISYPFAKIPAGNYQRGNASGDSDIAQAPVQTVYLSGYYLAEHCTTKAEWDTVRTWALKHGYTDLVEGSGKASDHPVQSVNWYDALKWANAASEKDGLTPCYKVAGAVYKAGTDDTVTCDWNATGYRLPTEAEWETGARGGLKGKRFPLGDKISQKRANYSALKGVSYDDSQAVNGYHPEYSKDKKIPYTSPVESFSANGYGLYDMDGNVCQWCWDRFGDYVREDDPRGPGTGTSRVYRGGSWVHDAGVARCAFRCNTAPSNPAKFYSRFNDCGFRLARRSP